MPTASWGHAFTSDAISFSVVDGKLVGTGKAAFAELGLVDRNGDGSMDAAELSSQLVSSAESVLQSIQKNVELSVNGEPLSIAAAWVNLPIPSASGLSEASPFVSITLVSAAFKGAATNLAITWHIATPNDAVILQTSDTVLIANLDEARAVSFNLDSWAAAGTFFVQGLRHIAFGPDHLLFLVVLTLGVFKVAIKKLTVVRAVKLVTAFTVGHALSFALAYFHLVSISASFIEPVIALSIVLAAVAALRKSEWEKRWFIASLIGLVHGLGFAASLSQLGIATSQHAAAILSFNAGIDVAQILVVTLAASFLAILRWLAPLQSEKIRIVSLVAIGALGLIWTVTRLFDALRLAWEFFNLFY